MAEPGGGEAQPAQQPIAIGCDHAGLALKNALRTALEQRGEAIYDVGTYAEASCDYPDFAHMVASGVAGGRYRMGLLVCGTGIGMAIAANRHPGVRATVCAESFSAKMARSHNDANVLCLGARVIGPGLALDIVEAFLSTPFEGGRHTRRVDKIEKP
jgi:ribose 5-phosphate isomerase B